MNAVSSVVGSINDLAGSGNSTARAMKAPADLDKQSKALNSFEGAVPVVITGTRNPTDPDFPGLREAMIGSAIWQIAHQAAGDEIAEKIKELALQLHRRGAEKILEASRPSSQSTKKPSKKRK